jgi:hypothetical protein
MNRHPMSNELYTLAYFTDHPKINQILQGIIGVFEKVFLGRIRGYYLQGSFGQRSAVTNSDLDLYVIFKDNFSSPVEVETAISLSQSCVQISPVLLEIKLGAELHLHKSTNAGIALNFKYTTQFLYGEDIRDQIPVPSVNDWVQWAMSAPQASLMVTRSTKTLIFPLRQPDPEAEFYGYDRQTIPDADGIDRPSSKWLVATVGWIATALVACQTEQYVGSKGEIVQLYKTQIHDQWTGLVEQVYEQCRNRWNYLIPNEEADRQKLRSLCQNALEFSNYYMMVYRDFILRELSEESSKNQLQCLKCLAHIIYPGDQEIASLLEKLQQSSDEGIRRAACETEEQIKQILDAA